MKKGTLLLCVLTLAAVLLSACGYAGPERAVRREMDLIRQLDESAIKAYVSYEDIRLSHSAPLEVGEETTEAVKLFFKNFNYRILSSTVSEDQSSATVQLEITNLDAKMLAEDLCRAMIEETVLQDGIGEQEGLASSFALMKACLEENTYPLVTTRADVQLTNTDRDWVIVESTELEDALAGGLVSYLRDPYLLKPEEVLECTLAPFASFTAQEWMTYLGFHDVFNTGSKLASEIDTVLAEQIASHFQYKILSVTQSDIYASAEVEISSLDLGSVLDGCRDALLKYAKTSASIRATDGEVAEKTAEYLLDGLRANEASVTNTLTVSLVNNGRIWEVKLNDSFADALLGGVDTAIDTLYPPQ